MAEIAIFLFLLLAPAAAYAYMRWLVGMRKNLITKQRRLIRDAFLRRAVSSATEQLNFNPAEASLIHEKEFVRGENAVVVQTEALYRNTHGEYFLFMCTAGDKGFIKHLPREAAKRFLHSYPEALEREFGASSLATGGQ